MTDIQWLCQKLLACGIEQHIYTIRDNEGQDWNGPRVREFDELLGLITRLAQ